MSSDAAFLLFLIFKYLFPFIALIVGGASAWFLWRKNKRRAKRLAVYAIITLGIGLIGPLSLEWFSARSWMKRITGIAFSPKIIFRYDTPREFNGDGYSLSLVQIPPDLVPRLTNAPILSKNGLPKLTTDHREGWRRVGWQHGPRNEDPDEIDHLLDWGGTKQASEVITWMQETLKRSDCLYSYLFYPHRDGAGNVGFYLIDPRTGRLLIIGSDTLSFFSSRTRLEEFRGTLPRAC